MILGIHHTSMSTPDVDRLAKFYNEQLGFEVVSRGEWTGGNTTADTIYGLTDTAVKSVMLKTSNSYLELFQFNRPVGAPGNAARPISDNGVTHIGVVVDDIQAEYARLKAAGMTFHCPPQSVGAIGWATYGRDPDGNIVELMQVLDNGPYPALPRT